MDIFLAFWFRFIFKYQSLVEAENFKRLKEVIYRDISIFKGKTLERLFIEIFKEQQVYTAIGHYWERGNHNEIDIVAIDKIDKRILIAEVKLDPRRFDYHKLVLKSHKLVNDYPDYEAEYRCLSLLDIDEF